MKNKKLFLVSLLIISASFFSSTARAEATTLYFNGAIDSNWNTLGNWWTDSGFSTQALALPTTTDDVIISSTVASNSGAEPSINTLVVNGTAELHISLTVTNGASFYDSSVAEDEDGFLPLNQTHRTWEAMTAAPNGDVYASVNGGDIYKQTGGVGDFEALGQTVRVWFAMAATPLGNIYAAHAGGDIYMQTNGIGDFLPLGQTSRNWQSMAAAPNGDVYAAVFFNGDIYKQTGGIGDFIALGQTLRGWKGLAAAPNGDVYASVNGGDIYKQTGGIGDFIALGQTSRFWGDMSAAPNGDIYVRVANDDVYKQTGGERNFESIGSSLNGTGGIAVAPNEDIYLAQQFTDIYKRTLNVITGDACFSPTATNDGTITGVVSVCEISIPTVTTGTMDMFSSSIASLSAEIEDTGGATANMIGIEYGLSTSYGNTKSTSGSFNVGEFITSLDSLSCDTTYHYRAFASSDAGTGYGNDATFSLSCGADPESFLYGVDGAGSNVTPALWLIDPDTGSKLIEKGETGFNITGLAFHPETGILYGTTGNNGNNPKSLVSVDLESGEGTYLGTIKNTSATSLALSDISFDSGGTLYGWYQGSEDDLYTLDLSSCDGVDTTCLATRIATTTSGLSTFGNGLAFDENDNLYLFGNGDDSYYLLSTTTGQVISEHTFVPSGSSKSIGAAAFDIDGTLFASRNNFSSINADLITINLDTHEITSKGENPDMRYMDALAFYFPPDEPEPTQEPEEEPTRHRSGGGLYVPPGALGITPIISTTTEPTEDLMALQNRINELRAQIKALQLAQGTSQIKVSDIITNLSMGTEGENVKALQTFLISQNLGPSSLALSTVGATGYFGILTQDALAEYQRINGITPPAGYFGPITKAFLRSEGF